MSKLVTVKEELGSPKSLLYALTSPFLEAHLDVPTIALPSTEMPISPCNCLLGCEPQERSMAIKSASLLPSKGMIQIC